MFFVEIGILIIYIIGSVSLSRLIFILMKNVEVVLSLKLKQ